MKALSTIREQKFFKFIRRVEQQEMEDTLKKIGKEIEAMK